ncbi:ISAs1 family transposase, partial [Aliivibrio sp. S3MY1]
IDKGWLGKEYRWDGIHSIVKVTAKVEEKLSGRKSEEIRWYISSLPLNARQALHAVRSHWQVESMHWVLDMTFREDESRIRRGTGALAFNVLRKIALSLFKQDTTKNISMVRKKKIAALDDEYRSVLLDAGIKML